MANFEGFSRGDSALCGCLLFCLLAYMAFCAVLALRSLKRIKPYTNWEVLTEEERKKFAGYERNDRHRLSYVRTGLGGFFLLPWRMIVAFSLLISNGVTGWLLFRFLGAGGDTAPARERLVRKLIGYVAHLHCRFLFCVMGVYRIQEVYLGSRQDPTKRPIDQPRILVSNHVSCLDIPYFIRACCAAFVAKPVVLVYRSSYIDLGFDMLPSFDWMVLTLSSPGLSTLDVYWLEPIDPPPAEKFQTDEERANAFADIVRNRMWEELKKRNPLTPQIAGPCPTWWIGSVSVRREIVQTLMERQGLCWKTE
ncbi:hypothetical protein NCLIV_048600 [Neospora caninum Liverpool]|uniref:Phospholipid/glycerol acyltransferase domain-containing protein n=1 Tax=Neospora caninum (strain Liverpool) TaxID=572307 RepID=F0VK30_NEOCL|nr:hypothetical protein NCLIV_048600 [Neospora caninum Liverpool]CBZ54431.1 hypothetical protein NCLIV_048600 [Neospora caninum Liverpool]|eukprot:XP_003884461.1 hypothetical protein NCLIV_048600 [Neospora caninum Liverpool]